VVLLLGKKKKGSPSQLEMYYLKLFVSSLLASACPRKLTHSSQETDKATIDVEAQDDGVLAKIIVCARTSSIMEHLIKQ
jgi:hypothetical protein